MMRMGIGYGKVILFGEHFVVYGVPAIAASVDRKTEIEISGLEGTRKELEQKIIADYEGRWKEKNLIEAEKETNWFRKILFPLLKEMNLEGNNFYLKIINNIPVGSGMGSSAAISVALVRELNEFFKLNLSNERVCELAYKAEEIFHGTPSGIDNTLATFRGIILFEKGKKIERLKVSEPINIVIARIKRKGNTKKLVASVKEFRERNLEEFGRMEEKERELVNRARKALENNDLIELGKLMNANQKLLEIIGVSTRELEELCEIALQNGALGAKLTGAGGGGCMIALAENEESQEKLEKALEKKSLEVIKTMIIGN